MSEHPDADIGLGPSFIRTGEEAAAALSYLAARVASVAELTIQGRKLTKDDLKVLETMRMQLLEEVASVSEPTASRRRPPEPTSAVAAGFTVDVLVQEKGGKALEDAEVLKALKEVADALGDLERKGKSDAAPNIARLFRKVSSWARTQSGSVGERIVGREAKFA